MNSQRLLIFEEAARNTQLARVYLQKKTFHDCSPKCACTTSQHDVLDLDPVFKYGGPTAKRKHRNISRVFKHDLRILDLIKLI